VCVMEKAPMRVDSQMSPRPSAAPERERAAVWRTGLRHYLRWRRLRILSSCMCVLMCVGGSAYSASATLSLRGKPTHVGDELHVSVAVVNNTEKAVRIGYPRAPSDANDWARFHRKTTGLAKDGKISVPRVPVRDKKTVRYRASFKVLKPKDEFAFLIDIRSMYSLPVPETGQYELTVLGARLAFVIRPLRKAVCTAYATTDPKWHRSLEYAVVPAERKNEWLLLGRPRNASFCAGTYLAFKPTFMHCVRVKMKQSARSINGVLVLLSAKDRLYYIDPRFTHYDRRMEADVRKMHYKRSIPSTAVPGISAIEKVAVFPNEFTNHVDYQITVRVAKTKKTIFLRQVRFKMEVIDKAKFNQGQKSLDLLRKEAEKRRKEEEKAEAEKHRIESARKLAEATPTPAELRVLERKALDKERAYKQKQVRERAAILLMKEAESARKKGQLGIALVQYMKVVEEYPETTHAMKAGELAKKTKTEIVLRSRMARTRARLSMATLKRALERIGRDDGMAVEMIMKRLRTQATDPEGLKNAQKLLVKAVPLALTKMRDKDAQVRMSAAIILGEVRPAAAKAVPALAKALKDKDIWVRVAAAVALGKIKPDAKDAIRSLRDAAKDSNARVRQAAREALGEIKKAREEKKGKAVPEIQPAGALVK
jgi:HEAT repeat protein